MAVGGGVGIVGLGVAVLVGGDTLLGVAAGGGVGIVGVGVAVLAGGVILLGAALIGVGVAAIGLSVAGLAGGSAVQRVRAWLDTMTADPDELPAAETTTQPPSRTTSAP